MSSDKSHNCQVFHFDLYGTREEKYEYLNHHSLGEVDWKVLRPEAPYNFFTPKDFSAKVEYEKGFKIEDLMPIYTTGLKSQQDKANIFFTPKEADTMLNEFINKTVDELKNEYGFKDNRDWTVSWSKADLQKHPVIERTLLYRPFDVRYLNYTGTTKGVVGYPRYAVLGCMLNHDNISFCTIRSNRDYYFDIFISSLIADKTLLSSKDDISQIPLYVYKENMGKEKRIVNFNKEVYEKIAKGLNYLPCYDDNVMVDPTSEYDGVLYPQDLFDYIYAVLHSPSYREHFKEFLKIDFPRIPYPTDWERFRDLVEKGEELRMLHLMEDIPSKTGITFPVASSMQVDFYRWKNNRVYINSEQYFEGVPESAWNFFIGGYQPAQKWLKDRKGMTLSFEDVKHYGDIIYVLLQTDRIMQEIDAIR